jgi:TonB family protein
MRGTAALALALCGNAMAQLYRLPAVLQREPVEYTAEARIAELEGNVGFNVTVDADGHLVNYSLTHRIGLGLDEIALDSMKRWPFRPGSGRTNFELEVPFRLASHQSRWHLVGVEFETTNETTRPEFVSTWYPAGAGLTAVSAIEHGQVVRAMNRLGATTISFEVDSRGLPTNFNVETASSPFWGPSAIEFLRQWRFRPAMHDGAPVRTRCAVNLVWGGRDLPDAIQAGGGAEIVSSTVTPEFIPPSIDSGTDVDYPQISLDAGLTGLVYIGLVVREDGTPWNVSVIQSIIGLDDAALEAVRRWHFLAATVDEHPVATPVVIEMRFSLDGSQPSVESRIVSAAGYFVRP